MNTKSRDNGAQGFSSLIRRTLSAVFQRTPPIDLARELSRLDRLQHRRDAMLATHCPFSEFEVR